MLLDLRTAAVQFIWVTLAEYRRHIFQNLFLHDPADISLLSRPQPPPKRFFDEAVLSNPSAT